jgi:hypothetical protein
MVNAFGFAVSKIKIKWQKLWITDDGPSVIIPHMVFWVGWVKN